MSAIAQRRVAGATALMILLYLVQVALFSPSAAATDGTTTYIGPDVDYVTEAPGWSGIQAFSPLTRAGKMPPTHDGGDGNHEADLFIAYDCGTETLYVQVLTLPGVTLDQDGDHFLKLDSDAPFDSGSTTKKIADDGTGNFGYIMDGDDAVGWTGSFSLVPGEYGIDVHTQVFSGGATQTASTATGSSTVPMSISCDTTTTTETTTTTTQPTTTTTEGTTSTTEATTTTTVPEEEVLGTTVTTVPDEEVLGATITTVPEVSADTLPFTGSESGDLFKMAMLALSAGALMLFAVRGPKEEDEVATDIGGWSSL